MTYIAPNGDTFQSKEDYDKLQVYAEKQRTKQVNVSAREERKIVVHQALKKNKKGICPDCGRMDNITKDYYGNPKCPNCFLLSL